MNLGEQARQRAQYKKGVLLGLTVAEAMLLILFALMLALGALLSQKDHSIASLGARLLNMTSQLRQAQNRAEVLQGLADGRAPESFIREVVLAREQMAEVARQRAALVEKERVLRENAQLAAALKNTSDPKDRTRELAALGARLEAETKKLSPQTKSDKLFDLVPEAVGLAEAAKDAGVDRSQATGMLKDAERTLRENSTLRGQVTRYRKELARMGKGGEYPPCWVTEAGEIQYLFDIELLGSGALRVRDVTSPSRKLDRNELPIPSQLLSGPVSRSQFIALTSPLFERGREKECRFVVIARDRTGAGQKELFKTLLLTVEGHFYKSLRK
ncbi:hypothetical protein [Phenylobacterium sp.]|uniref:hypothetical protein n=1 Tax=Phenylobacterium sp. TaxID=1871053 RepID=UPI002737AF30|nr:hypothetical protein [Phenylobacterium sp.]MDP3870416.1 hypothetical protein [Phenylobacterium sp.]